MRLCAKTSFTLRFFADCALYILLCLAAVWLIADGAASSGYFWQWYRVGRVFLFGADGSLFGGALFQGLALTMRIGAVSLVLALSTGLAATALRLAGGPVARALSVSYIQLIRNTPLLVQILFMYFVVAPGLGLEAEASAIIALSLFEGAYMSEILRGGVLALPKGQYEAALSLGLPPFWAVASVILPQALRGALPPLLNECVTLIKNTSLASVISVSELTFKGKIAISSTFMSLEIWFTVALVYLSLSLLLSGFANIAHRRLNRGWASGR